MTYKRWKEIRNMMRSPYFNSSKMEELGISTEEYSSMMIDSSINKKYSKQHNIIGKVKVVGCLGTVLFCVLFWWIPIALVQNYYETKAIENLTGKDVGYWDVLWAGDIIRANAELQNKPK